MCCCRVGNAAKGDYPDLLEMDRVRVGNTAKNDCPDPCWSVLFFGLVAQPKANAPILSGMYAVRFGTTPKAITPILVGMYFGLAIKPHAIAPIFVGM